MTNIEVYEIDDNVPLPDEVKVIPLETLDVGSSILFPNSRRAAVQAYASRIKRNSGKVFTIKKLDEANARIWRVK